MRTNGNNQAGDVMRASENIQNIHLKECKNILKQVKMCVCYFFASDCFFNLFFLFVCLLTCHAFLLLYAALGSSRPSPAGP